MISERQINFRNEYRSRVATWYNGYCHILIIYFIGFSTIYICSKHIAPVLWWEWLTIPVVILLCNIFEWFLHMKVMHRPINESGMRAIYTRHTLNHHQFFSDNEMRFRDQKDWRVTVFPPYALVVFILLSIPACLLFGFLISANVGWLVMATTTSMYLTYEFMHFCCHLDDNFFVRYCPLVNTLRRHHTAHHNKKLMMEVNMNLTFPISDWMFGTSDLNRGLFGHLLNGYSTKHLKTGLRAQPTGPVETSTQPYRVH